MSPLGPLSIFFPSPPPSASILSLMGHPSHLVDPENSNNSVLLHRRQNKVPSNHPSTPSTDNSDSEIDVDDDDGQSTTTGPSCPSPSSSILDESGRLHSRAGGSLHSPAPTMTLSDALRRHHREEQQRQVQAASLFFSIANILRPDFGLGRIPPSPINSIPPQPTNHHRKRTKDTDHGNVKKSKSNSSNPIGSNNPIDLSRSNAGSKVKEPSIRKSKLAHPDKGTKEKPLPPGKDRSDDKRLWPAWVYCTRYSDRPSSGPRNRKTRKPKEKDNSGGGGGGGTNSGSDEKRPRTAFTSDQLSRLRREFDENRYLTEKRRQDLATELQLHENQIKIWFQNKRAKLKKSTGQRGNLAVQLMAQGLYNHSTVPMDDNGSGGSDEDTSD